MRRLLLAAGLTVATAFAATRLASAATASNGINDAGAIVGTFADKVGQMHGFLRS